MKHYRVIIAAIAIVLAMAAVSCSLQKNVTLTTNGKDMKVNGGVTNPNDRYFQEN